MGLGGYGCDQRVSGFGYSVQGLEFRVYGVEGYLAQKKTPTPLGPP